METTKVIQYMNTAVSTIIKKKGQDYSSSSSLRSVRLNCRYISWTVLPKIVLLKYKIIYHMLLRLYINRITVCNEELKTGLYYCVKQKLDMLWQQWWWECCRQGVDPGLKERVGRTENFILRTNLQDHMQIIYFLPSLNKIQFKRWAVTQSASPPLNPPLVSFDG